MSEQLPPMVCLDGNRVRAIRENQKLTQLYVAKVVGVTTDTISRWENNRYPSIKKENVLRLAEALEVAVEDLLKNEEEAGSEGGEVSAEPAASRKWLLGLVVLILASLLAALLFKGREMAVPAVLAERILPAYAAPGSIIPVQIHLKTEEPMKGFILREHFPPGWKLIEASPPASSLDNEKGAARWIIRTGDSRKHLVYLVRVGSSETLAATADFSGDIVANSDNRQTPASILGQTSVEIGPFQWADLDGDQTIDDSEILRAYDMVEEMTGVHLDWEIVDTIWDAGSYRWEEKTKEFIPVRSEGGPSQAE
ncbi:helix-turn-helix transcriptional regulator [Desulfuromonas sp. AOP6]|uniref:helix-turn-helix transcriptional regulator n=1 Tax=Desulfuromonas sp. AOP6 TaxID=1566351 RepID=UPI00127F068C|nr:helix-turn-helix transcriptional regulator [Desulfuromonas sp. AOP6]BCA79423.1 transcriptional regulator [Desulfuromonas sp. AOP6]